MHQLKSDMQSEKIPTRIANSVAKSHCRCKNDPFIHTGKPLIKVFHMPLRQTALALNTAKLIHWVCKPATTVHIIPGLQNSLLLGIRKIADAQYITNNTKITSTNKPMLRK